MRDRNFVIVGRKRLPRPAATIIGMTYAIQRKLIEQTVQLPAEHDRAKSVAKLAAALAAQLTATGIMSAGLVLFREVGEHD